MLTSYEYEPGKTYDAIIVLSGGLALSPAGYRSTTYQDRDLSGMLGGCMRVRAAAELLKREASRRFVFTTGVTARNQDQFGPDVPTEASVYGREFGSLKPGGTWPRIILEQESTNTTENLIECLRIISMMGWGRVAIVSSDYHLPRVEALAHMLHQQMPVAVAIDYISAEAVLRRVQPGMYDQEIDEAYASPLGQLRQHNESVGLARIQSGQYALGEQLQRGA